jgi:hypothetical protein
VESGELQAIREGLRERLGHLRSGSPDTLVATPTPSKIESCTSTAPDTEGQHCGIPVHLPANL